MTGTTMAAGTTRRWTRLDHLDADDMRQASIVLASFLWNAANADKLFPRRPLPT